MRRILKLIPLEEAVRITLSQPEPTVRTEYLSILDAVGRILAEDVTASEDIPAFDYCFYDGYALSSRQTLGVSREKPIRLGVRGSILPGAIAEHVLVREGEAVYLASGAPLPPGADTVLRVEEAERVGDSIEIKRLVPAGENIVTRGSDVAKGSTVFRVGDPLRPQDIGLLCELGVSRVKVIRRPVAGVFTVGDELHRASIKDPSRVVDNYSLITSLLLREMGVQVRRLGIVSDKPRSIVERLNKSTESSDFTVIVGGASIGENDFVPEALSSIGERLFHGVRVSPGKVCGLYAVKDKPVFLAPGHVMSAIACHCLFIAPYVASLYYGSSTPFATVRARLETTVDGKRGVYAFRALRVRRRDGEYTATYVEKPLGGSSLLSTLVEGNGFALVPPNQRFEAGSTIDVTLYSGLETLMLGREAAADKTGVGGLSGA